MTTAIPAGSTRSQGSGVDDATMSQLTPLRFLERSAAVHPDKVAIVHDGRRITYREFAREATRVARALIARGLQPGDRVAYLCRNVPELLIAHFAVPLARGVLVAINTRLAPEEIRYILRHSGARILVVESVAGRVTADRVVISTGVRRGDHHDPRSRR